MPLHFFEADWLHGNNATYPINQMKKVVYSLTHERFVQSAFLIKKSYALDHTTQEKMTSLGGTLLTFLLLHMGGALLDEQTTELRFGYGAKKISQLKTAQLNNISIQEMLLEFLSTPIGEENQLGCHSLKFHVVGNLLKISNLQDYSDDTGSEALINDFIVVLHTYVEEKAKNDGELTEQQWANLRIDFLTPEQRAKSLNISIYS